ncbi:hypothetical protein [Amycolatopsis jiangsuensis]|uniref:Uncharacterized protein n=1 Tax=Amycolatopsis jiangsuensis TaxID=1181879 RepID=A0A840IVC0_9PSEU|nr:hypothetical protein [Amycolatopsis jiangsuensis]MBB4685820.1 hypothetical protein [Amycolatopsis jiangsuensis]
MTTAAEDQRDQAEARVSALRRQLRAGLAELPALADAERTQALDVLVARAENLLRTEQDAEVAAEQVRLARMESKRAVVQRTVLYLAVAPVAAGMVSGALLLFGVLGVAWVLFALPLLGAGLRIAFGPIGPTPLMVGRRLRAAYLGALAAVLTTVALLVPGGTAETVLVVLAAVATAATAACLVQEVR